jgi:hypothetical protein
MSVLWKSTYPENLKRIQVRVELGYLLWEDYETQTLADFNKAAEKFANAKGVKFFKKNVEIDEWGHTETRLIFYYERPETDEEYEKRIVEYEVDDLKDFYNSLLNYNNACLVKDKIKKLHEKHVVHGKLKGLLPYWQKEMLDNFFNEPTHQEAFSRGYKEGQAEGKKEVQEIRKKLESV